MFEIWHFRWITKSAKEEANKQKTPRLKKPQRERGLKLNVKGGMKSTSYHETRKEGFKIIIGMYKK